MSYDTIAQIRIPWWIIESICPKLATRCFVVSVIDCFINLAVAHTSIVRVLGDFPQLRKLCLCGSGDLNSDYTSTHRWKRNWNKNWASPIRKIVQNFRNTS